jgi:hypothetical protein
LLVLGGGCRARTQIMVGVLTDLRAPDALNGAQIVILRDGVPVVDELWDIPGGIGRREILPGSYAIYSPRDTDERIEVQLVGLKDRQPVVNRRARVNLVSRQTLFMRMALVAGCMAKSDCGAGLTCIEGTCVSDEVDARTLPAFSPDLVTTVKCNSGTSFVSTETNEPMPVMGSCGPTELCEEGTCYKPVLADLWQQQLTPSQSTLRAVWGTADGQRFWAVGDGGTILHLGPSGFGGGGATDEPMTGDPRPFASTWVAETSPTTANLRGVFGVDANHVWAVGDDGTILFRNNGVWTRETLQGTSGPLNAVWAADVDRVWAVGRDDQSPPSGVIFRRDPDGTWRREDAGAVGDLHGVHGSSPDDVWAVGLGLTVMHFNGGSWQRVTVATPADGGGGMQDLFGVFASNGKVYAVGSPGLYYVIRRAGAGGAESTAFTINVDGRPAGLRSIWASGQGTFLVGDDGVILRSRGEESFDSEPSGVLAALRGVFGGAGQIYVVGETGVILFSNARRPSGGNTAPQMPADMGAVLKQCDNPDQCLGAGSGNACCGGQCVNTSTSLAHCGGCDRPCSTSCEAGQCAPTTGPTDAGVASDPCDPTCGGGGFGCVCNSNCGGVTYVMDCQSGSYCECHVSTMPGGPINVFDIQAGFCTDPRPAFFAPLSSGMGCEFPMPGGGQ